MSALQKEIEDILRRVLEDTRPHQTVVMPDARSWDVKQCAEYLSISEGLLRAKVASGEIPHFRVGNRVLFHPHEIRNWRGTTEVSIYPESLTKLAEGWKAKAERLDALLEWLEKKIRHSEDLAEDSLHESDDLETAQKYFGMAEAYQEVRDFIQKPPSNS